MDDEDLLEEILSLCQIGYIQGFNDGANGFGYDFDWLTFRGKIKDLIGGIK